MSRPRWSVCVGGYPNGWEPPLIETDDPREAVRVYAKATESTARMTTAAIFDDHGEGEPLSPEQVDERLDREGDTPPLSGPLGINGPRNVEHA